MDAIKPVAYAAAAMAGGSWLYGQVYPTVKPSSDFEKTALQLALGALCVYGAMKVLA